MTIKAKRVFLTNLHYFFAQTDGTYAYPNGAIGDLLKQAKEEIEALEKTESSLKSQLEDVVTVLDLSESMLAEHGPHGTSPAELTSLVLEQKDRTITMLRNGFKEIGY